MGLSSRKDVVGPRPAVRSLTATLNARKLVREVAQTPSSRAPVALPSVDVASPSMTVSVDLRGVGMNIGVTIFITDRSVRPDRLGAAVEDRGFQSLYVS